MADIDKFVRTTVVAGGDGSSGDPYDTIDTAITHMMANLTGGQTGRIYCEGATNDNPTNISMAAFAVGADITVEIRPWDDFAASTSGRYIGNLSWNSNFYSIETDPSSTAIFDLDDTTGNVILDVQGIQVHVNATGNKNAFNIENGNRLRMRKCRLRGPNGTGFHRGIRTSGGTSGLVALVENSIIFDWNSGYNGNTAEDATFVNTAFHNNDVGTAAGEAIESGTGTVTVQNCLGWNNWQDYRDEGATEVFNTNAGADTGIDPGFRGTGGVDIASGGLSANITDNNATSTLVDCRAVASGNYNTLGGTGGSVPGDDIKDDDRNLSGSTAAGPFAAIAGEGGAPSSSIMPFMMANH